MKELAINGGTPAFQPDELAKLVPAWPPVYPETDQKLLEVYHSGKWGLCGKYEQLLMQEFAAFQDAKYSVWMCNGTTTLECALLALGVGPGDEVIVPGVTWIATAKRAKELGYDAIHDTVHEMAKDEARHGQGFVGLLKRYFGE